MSKVELDKEKLVSERLQAIGVPCHVSGFAMLKDAILLVIDDVRKLQNITTGLYVAIGVKFGTKGANVERSIRHALELTWERKSTEELTALIGPMVNYDRMANSEFIATVAEKLRLELKQKAS